jgi:hypothetical protein
LLLESILLEHISFVEVRGANTFICTCPQDSWKGMRCPGGWGGRKRAVIQHTVSTEGFHI